MIATDFRASSMQLKGEGGFFRVVKVLQQRGFAKSAPAGYSISSYSEGLEK